MKIIIKKPTNKNINEIKNIENNVYKHYGWSKEAFKKEINNTYSKFLIAFECEKSKIIGYIGAWVILDEAHLITMVTDPFYRRRHVADILLYNLILLLQNKIRWLTLEVKSSNTPALNLYKRFGFREIGIRKNYYQSNNEDAVILWTEDINTEAYKNIINNINNIILKFYINTDKYQYSSR